MKAMVGGLLLSYELVGRGEPVGLLHGLGLDRRMWDYQLSALTRHFRVLAWDARGHGQSERVHTPFSIEDVVDDLRGLLAALGIDRLALVGVSMGGCVAQAFALKYPDQVSALVLVSTMCSHRTVEAALLARAHSSHLFGIESLVEPTLGEWFTDEFRAEHPTLIETYRSMLRENDPQAHARCCEALASFHVAADLHSIRQPTLVVAGDQGPGASPQVAREMHGEIAGSQLWIVQNARHLVPVEHPGAFNERVVAFLTASIVDAI